MSRHLRRLGYATFALTLAAIAAISLLGGLSIDAAKVPMQWDWNGHPTWSAPKAIGLWFPLVFAALIGSILIQRARYSASRPVTREWLHLIAACGILLAVHAWHISAVAAWARQAGAQ